MRFFLESEEGHDFVTEDLDGSDLYGWLVPEVFAAEAENLWKSGEAEELADFGKWMIWSGDAKALKINFVDF